MTSLQVDHRGLLLPCPQCGQRNRMMYQRLGTTFRCGKCRRSLPPPDQPVEVQSDALFDALISKSSLPVLVDFWAHWCGPCKMVAPEIARLASEDAGRFVVAKVDTEQVPSLARKFLITAIPTMVLFRGGAEIARQAGAMPARAIRQFVEPWIGAAKS